MFAFFLNFTYRYVKTGARACSQEWMQYEERLDERDFLTKRLIRNSE